MSAVFFKFLTYACVGDRANGHSGSHGEDPSLGPLPGKHDNSLRNYLPIAQSQMTEGARPKSENDLFPDLRTALLPGSVPSEFGYSFLCAWVGFPLSPLTVLPLWVCVWTLNLAPPWLRLCPASASIGKVATVTCVSLFKTL